MKTSSQITQQDIEALLSRSKMFAILWMGGFGSAIAIFLGLRVKVLLRKSGPELFGVDRANRRILWGSIGLSPIFLLVVIGLFKQIF